MYLKGNAAVLELDIAESIDANLINNGRIDIDGAINNFDWTQRNFTAPTHTGTGVDDGTAIIVSLTGELDGKSIRVANKRSLQVLQVDGDIDNDGINNGIEHAIGLNPLTGDSDNDGVPDAIEDTDGDGLTNARELELGTDLGNEDSDGDGLSDGDESNVHNTNPLAVDTDNDGLPDDLEVAIGSSPTDPSGANVAAYVTSLTVSPTEIERDFSSTMSPIDIRVDAELTVNGKDYVVNVTDERYGTNYSVSNAAVAVAQNNGRFTVIGEGVADLQVNLGATSAVSTLTVNPPVASELSLSLAPSTPRLYADSGYGVLWLHLDSPVPVEEIIEVRFDGETADILDDKADFLIDEFAREEYKNSDGIYVLLGNPGRTLDELPHSNNFVTYSKNTEVGIMLPNGVASGAGGLIEVDIQLYGETNSTTLSIEVPVVADPAPQVQPELAPNTEINVRVGEPIEIPLNITDEGNNDIEVRYLLNGEPLSKSPKFISLIEFGYREAGNISYQGQQIATNLDLYNASYFELELAQSRVIDVDLQELDISGNLNPSNKTVYFFRYSEDLTADDFVGSTNTSISLPAGRYIIAVVSDDAGQNNFVAQVAAGNNYPGLEAFDYELIFRINTN